jgi:hypothetical protein
MKLDTAVKTARKALESVTNVYNIFFVDLALYHAQAIIERTANATDRIVIQVQKLRFS